MSRGEEDVPRIEKRRAHCHPDTEYYGWRHSPMGYYCLTCDRLVLYEGEEVPLTYDYDLGVFREKGWIEALDLEYLKGLGKGAHIWVKCIEETWAPGRKEPFVVEFVTSALTDEVDGMGVVAIWCASTDKSDWFQEKDYGTKWWAYLDKPRKEKPPVVQRRR